MSFTYLRALPTPEEIKQQYPLSAKLAAIKADRDNQIKDIISGKDDRLLLIIGPCSADHEDPVVDYVSRLAPVQEKVKDRILIVPRIYTNKPRTTGEGYKGIASQPDPEKAPDMITADFRIRQESSLRRRLQAWRAASMLSPFRAEWRRSHCLWKSSSRVTILSLRQISTAEVSVCSTMSRKRTDMSLHT